MSHHLGIYHLWKITMVLVLIMVSSASGRASIHQVSHSSEGFTEPNLPGNVGKIPPSKKLWFLGKKQVEHPFIFVGRNIENHNQLKHWLKLLLMKKSGYPPDMYKTLRKLGYLLHQLVQDFFHQHLLPDILKHLDLDMEKIFIVSLSKSTLQLSS